MTVVDAPTGETSARPDFIGRASALVPLLRKHAPWSEENRRLHDEAVEAIAEAGLFRLRTPRRYGGYEADTRTVAGVAAELSRGDGAAGWTASVYWIPTWMAGLFPDTVQDEVFSMPDVRVCGTLSPSASATPVPGGIRVSGRWSFISGAHHSQWQEILAMAPAPGGQGLWPIMALVPMSDLQVIDDWHTSGLRGSGSVSTVAEDLFVPEERVLPLVSVMQGQHASVLNGDSAMYKAPLLGMAAATSVGTFLGLANAAWESFFERLPNRKITYTEYESQHEAPITHLQVANARLKIDQAGFHADRVTSLVDTKAAAGQVQWSLDERGQARADIGAVSQLAKEAVDILNDASGGSSIYQSVPIQRIARDIHAATKHALIYPPTSFELYGRVLCGLEPNSTYI